MISPFYALGEWLGAGFIAAAAGAGHWAVKQLWYFFRHGPKSPTDLIRRDQEIGRLLRELRIVCGANRAFLASFKNGTFYVGNEPEFRYSWTHEDTDTSSSSVANRFKDIPTTLVPDEMQLVEEPGPSFTLVAGLPDSAFRHMCIEGGTEAVARCAVRKSVGGKPVAFIGLDFVRTVERPERINDLVTYAARMERLLTGTY